LGDVTYWVVLHSVVCDAPARSYLKCIRPHNCHGCERCTETGDWVTVLKNRVTFPSVDKPVRTDAAFAGMTDKDHHEKDNESPMICLSFGMVTQFPLDIMHFVYLGVMRRLILFWLHGPVQYMCRLSSHYVSEVSERLLSQRDKTICVMSFREKHVP